MYHNFHTIRQYDHFKKFITSDIIIHGVKFVNINYYNETIRQIEKVYNDSIVMKCWFIDLISYIRMLNINNISFEYKLITKEIISGCRFHKIKNDYYVDVKSDCNNLQLTKISYYRNKELINSIEKYRIVKVNYDGYRVLSKDVDVNDEYLKTHGIDKAKMTKINNLIKEGKKFNHLLNHQ